MVGFHRLSNRAINPTVYYFVCCYTQLSSCFKTLALRGGVGDAGMCKHLWTGADIKARTDSNLI